IYKKNEETNLVSNKISSFKIRTKKNLQTTYNLPNLEQLETTSLNAKTNAEVRELIDEQNDTDETDLDEEDDSQLEIDRDLELDLQNKISKMNNW
ncbi:14818_t:CDS:2, partial [Dentiscutata erythropus]